MNKSAENLAYEAILEMILSKEFSPGDRLVESEIAERLNLSRTPVRNVMRQLVAEGLLEVKENKGCYIFKARAYMEGHASLEAASCRTEADILLLEEMIHKERAFYSEGKLKEYSEVNNAFHLSIARICKNTYIEKFTRQLFWRSELYIFHFDKFYTPASPKELLRNPDESISCSQHLQIVNAIVAADGALAEGAMRSHIYTTFSRMSGRNPQAGICVPGFFTKTI